MISVYVAPFDQSRPITVQMYATQFYNYAKQLAPDATPEQLKNLEMFAKNIKTRHEYDLSKSVESNTEDKFEGGSKVSQVTNNEQEKFVKLGGPGADVDNMMAKKDIEIFELKEKVSKLETIVADFEFERTHYVFNDVHSPQHIEYIMEKLDDWQIDMYSMKYTFQAKLDQSRVETERAKIEAEKLRKHLDDLQDARAENLDLRVENQNLKRQLDQEQVDHDKKYGCALDKIDMLNYSIEELKGKNMENDSFF